MPPILENPLPKSDFFLLNIDRPSKVPPKSDGIYVSAFGDDFISLENATLDKEYLAIAKAPQKINKLSKKESPPKRVTLKFPWISGTNTYSEHKLPHKILEQELKDFVRYFSPKPEEHAIRKLVIFKIRRCVTKFWQDAVLEVFGSFDTELYLPDGDLDLVVIGTGEREYGKANDIYALANRIVHKKLLKTGSLQVIIHARVPLIKYNDRQTGIKIDISFSRASGLDTKQWTLRAFKVYPVLRPLVLFVKYYLHVRALDIPFQGGLGSYSAICMCLSFLTLHPHVSSGRLDQNANWGVQLLEFFELYGELMCYEAIGLDIAGQQYFNKLKPPAGYQPSMNGSLLSIIDPMDPTNDVARVSPNFTRVKTAFSTAFEVLTMRILTIYDELNTENQISLPITILGALVQADDRMEANRARIISAWEKCEAIGITVDEIIHPKACN